MPNPFQILITKLSDWAQRNPEAAEQLAWWTEYVLEAKGANDSTGLRAIATRVLPPNWLDLSHPQALRAAELMGSTGLCVAWVPRATVINKLLLEKDAQGRDAVLALSQDEILADLTAAVEEISQIQLQRLQQGVGAAVEAFREGHQSAAQALCVPLVTELLEVHLDTPHFKAAKAALYVDSPASMDPRGTRAAVVQAALHIAIRHSSERGLAAGFNRHSSAHGFDPAQYTPSHGLAALMLTVGSLREVNEAYREFEAKLPHYPAAFSDAVRRRETTKD